jgi:DNA-binding response OmpR family regulator
MIPGAVGGLGPVPSRNGDVGSIRAVKVLLVSPDPRSRELMALAVAGIERRLGEPIGFLEASDGEAGARIAFRERPDAVVADEIASRAGAFALAKDLRGAAEPYPGVIVILLERRQDAWLADWAGADAWFVRPVDPFELADRLLALVGGTEQKETA